MVKENHQHERNRWPTATTVAKAGAVRKRCATQAGWEYCGACAKDYSRPEDKDRMSVQEQSHSQRKKCTSGWHVTEILSHLRTNLAEIPSVGQTLPVLQPFGLADGLESWLQDPERGRTCKSKFTAAACPCDWRFGKIRSSLSQRRDFSSKCTATWLLFQ